MIRNLVSKNTMVQRLTLALITIAIFWDGLWAGQPRADQIIYLHHMSGMRDFWEIMETAPSFNRTHSGDTILYRPVLFILLGICYSLFGDNYILWQLTGLSLHISTILVLHAILCRAPILRGTLLPLALALLYGSSEMGAEMVLWNHINGYLLFAFLSLLQLYFLLKFFASGIRRFAALSAITCFIAVFTYELGMVLSLLNACFLILTGRLLQFRTSQKISLSSTPSGFCYKLAGIFIAISFCYPLVSILSLYENFGGLAGAEAYFIDIDIILIFQYLAIFVGHWIYSLLMPTTLVIQAGSRTLLHDYNHELNIISIINYSATIMIILAFVLLLTKLRRHDYIRMAVPTFMGLTFLSSYSFFITIGRVLPNGPADVWEAITYPIYYSNFAQLTLLVTIGLALITLGKPKKDLAANTKSIGITSPHFLIVGLLVLVTLNGTYTANLTNMHRELNAPAQKMLTALGNWHNEPQSKKGDYYSVSKSCQNELLPWFGEDYIRKGTRWKNSDLAGKFTLADALYPETSYNLNKTKAHEQGARVTKVECSDGE